jgi:short subunit dehydrogenase-like uncharacterized protein
VNERDLDVVVFGATGVTGREVARYLAERTDTNGTRWAAAARDVAKLERVLGGIGVSAPEAIAADVDDANSLAAMAARARVVLNLVGPYTRYGQPVIEACVAGGAHYVDLTGEIPFVRRVIDAFDFRASKAGVKVVQVCGFEALPFDLAVLLAAETVRERWGEALTAADLEFSVRPPAGMPRPSDAVSGGTLQSVAEVTMAENAAAVRDPAALIDDPYFAAEVRARSLITVAPRRGLEGSVIAPMTPAAFINPAVIHRTAALRAAESGTEGGPFRYREGVAMGGGPVSLPLRYALAGALAGTQATIAGITRTRPSVRRRLGGALRTILPSSGFGPSGDRLEGWTWRMSVVGRTTGGREVRVEVEAEGHPGYLTTARMLGEVGLMIAEPELTPERAGCLTPATALGTGSLERFERAGVRFRVR